MPSATFAKRGGSHNLVVGCFHSFTSLAFGGLVAGHFNTISNAETSVSGGQFNTASGGGQNTASAVEASISGGPGNTASFQSSSVSGAVGRIFLAGARRALVRAQEAVAQAKEAVKGERGRLSIGNIGPLCQAFLPDARARFRQRFPLVEVTVVHMHNRRQIDALLNDSIMLGIGFPVPNMDDESLTATALLQSPICVVCSEHRWPAKRRIPKLVDFRYDDFLTLAPETAPDHMNLVRTACLRDGGFEPKLLPIGNTFDSLISMVAAGRGVVISPEILLRNLHLPAAVNSYILEDSQSKFELFLLRKKEPEPAATVNNFAKILFESVRRLQSHSKGAKRLVISSSARFSG